MCSQNYCYVRGTSHTSKSGVNVPGKHASNTSARTRTTGTIFSEEGGHVDVYDATVIGLGAVGSFAIRSLDKKEQKERVCANK